MVVVERLASLIPNKLRCRARSGRSKGEAGAKIVVFVVEHQPVYTMLEVGNAIGSICRSRQENEEIRPRVAFKDVVALAAADRVVTSSTLNQIIAICAGKKVVSAVAVNVVLQRIPDARNVVCSVEV